jgi:hypothetical protein
VQHQLIDILRRLARHGEGTTTTRS